jgi:hypothetical protein
MPNHTQTADDKDRLVDSARVSRDGSLLRKGSGKGLHACVICVRLARTVIAL